MCSIRGLPGEPPRGIESNAPLEPAQTAPPVAEVARPAGSEGMQLQSDIAAEAPPTLGASAQTRLAELAFQADVVKQQLQNQVATIPGPMPEPALGQIADLPGPMPEPALGRIEDRPALDPIPMPRPAMGRVADVPGPLPRPAMGRVADIPGPMPEPALGQVAEMPDPIPQPALERIEDRPALDPIPMPRPAAGSPDGPDDIRGDRLRNSEDVSDETEKAALELQQRMDRNEKMTGTLSNVAKKSGDQQDEIVDNIK